MELDAQDIINAITQQRNRALDEAAQAQAAAVKFQKENATLMQSIAELTKDASKRDRP